MMCYIPILILVLLINIINNPRQVR